MNTDQDDIVISGIAGQFPECRNIAEFCNFLYEGKDFVTANERRFKPGFQGLPKRSGTLFEADKFDNIFFGIPPNQVNSLDPRHRLLLESVYECIVDAGLNPKEVRGTKTGVYIGLSSFDPMCSKEDLRGRSTGMLAALAANRISYLFDFKGPSYICDTACSSSFYSLVNAFRDLRSGEINNAIVASANLNFKAYETLEFQQAGILSPDGTCKTFSSERNGYVRSEAVVALMLQRQRVSRRIYATIVGGKLNADGYKIEGGSFPSAEGQYQLMKDLYNEFNIDVNEISYFETHGTGTLVGDASECRAVAKMFGDRSEPLLIGSLKSNMGHTETTAGLCSVIKAILTFQTGNIPANINFNPIDFNLPGIKEGKLQVVTENTKFHDGLIAINCFGVGGANGHVVLKPCTKSQIIVGKNRNRLVLASGTTLEAVDHLLDNILKHKDDIEWLALMEEIFKSHIDGHSFRGYMVLGDSAMRGKEKYVGQRPICFVYPGMGSQWKTMGCELLKIPGFRETFERCASCVTPYGIDLFNLVTSNDDNVLLDISNSFVAISAVEIALTDVLSSLGIKPDYFIGHSSGEQVCAYANGGMTPEEAVLLSYARGIGYKKAKDKIIRGQMAVVGLSKEALTPILPNEIYIACQNSSELVTISGPEDITNQFVKELESRSVYVNPVDSCGKACHTKYIEEAALHSLEFMKTLLRHPQLRSKNWITSSIESSQEQMDWSLYNCAEYHYNNICNTVLFDEALKQIPKNAVVIEVGPHALLQSILKSELGPGTTIIPLINKYANDIGKDFLSVIGRIYTAGGQPYLGNFNDKVTFPVSRGTPMISPMVKWDHSTAWFTPVAKPSDSFNGSVVINLSKSDYSHLLSNEVDGKIIMPGMTYVVMIWRIIAEEYFLRNHVEVPLIIEKLSFKRITVLSPNEDNVFDVQITKSGFVEINESGSLVVSAYIKPFQDLPQNYSSIRDPVEISDKNLIMKKNDFYKHFYLRGQSFRDNSRRVMECDITGCFAKVEWCGKFDCFLENVVQLTTFQPNSKDLVLATYIEKIFIDPDTFLKMANQKRDISVSYDPQLNITRCAGIKIVELEVTEVCRTYPKIKPVLEEQQFVPYTDLSHKYDFETAASVALQIVLQNCIGVAKRPRICHLISKEPTDNEILSIVKSILVRQPLTEAEYHQLLPENIQEKYDVIIINETVTTELNGLSLGACLTKEGFVLYFGSLKNLKSDKFHIIFETVVTGGYIYLLRPHYNFTEETVLIKVSNSDFTWVDTLKLSLENEKNKLIHLYSEGEELSGIVGLIKCLCTEESNCRATVIEDNECHFDNNNEFYQTQLMKNLTINVLKEGKWGTYVHLHFEPSELTMVANATVQMNETGELSSLRWVQSPAYSLRKSVTNEVVCVFYAALNTEDTMFPTGQLQNPKRNRGICHEFSGICGERRVMSLTKNTGLSLQTNIHPYFSWDVPNLWSLQDAATVPVAYTLNYYALNVKCQLQRKQSILVNMGKNPIALAGISIAEAMECMIFVMICNDSDRKMLKDNHPLLNDEYIGFYKDEKFRKFIWNTTNQEGVDYILNYLDKDTSETKLLSKNGHYIEFTKGTIGKLSLASSALSFNQSSHRISLGQIFSIRSNEKKKIQASINKGLENNIIKPLPRIVYQETELEIAFKYIQSQQKLDKILIEIRKETDQNTRFPVIKEIAAKPKLYFSSEKSYILVGGTGGFGLELTDWMIRRGARKIILNSRRGMTTGYQAFCLHKWAKYSNVYVEVHTDDTTTLTGAKKLIQKAQLLGPVDGIFNMTLLLRDNSIRNQTAKDFEVVFHSKMVTASNMDIASRIDCADLNYFVGFSSICTGRGNGGQTNYGMANSAMERLCEKRRREHLPGLAIQWGPIDGVGAYEDLELSAFFKHFLIPQSIGSCLSVLETYMLQSSSVCSSILLQETKMNENDISNKCEVAVMICRILGIDDFEKVDKSLKIAQLGLDSLMAAEVKQNLYRNYKLELSLNEIRDMSFADFLKISNC